MCSCVAIKLLVSLQINNIMDRKFMSPQEIIALREKKITKFLKDEVGDKTIYGWQLIIRKHNDAAISKSAYVCGLEKMVYKLSDDKHEVLLDSGAIAIKAYTEQQRFEAQGIDKVYLDCGVAQCSREGRTILGTSLQKALELTPNQACRTNDINAIINCLSQRNIHTIGDLVCFGREEIADLRNIGNKRLNALDETLDHYHAAWQALKRPRNVMNGSVVLELQVVVKDKNL